MVEIDLKAPTMPESETFGAAADPVLVFTVGGASPAPTKRIAWMWFGIITKASWITWGKRLGRSYQDWRTMCPAGVRVTGPSLTLLRRQRFWSVQMVRK